MSFIINLLTEYGFFVGVPIVLLAIVVWIYRPSAKRRYKADGDIPFDLDKQDSKSRKSAQ